MTVKKPQLPMKLLRLVMMLSFFADLSTAESKPFFYMCDRTAELHVIWAPPPPADSRNSSRTTDARLCLYNQNRDSQAIVLTNATKSEVRVPDRRWHLVFRIPADDMVCKYYYKLKIEPLLSSVETPSSPASSNCSSATPAEYCELEMGRSQLCPNSPTYYNTPLECMVLPANFTFLRDLCTAEPPLPPPNLVLIIVASTAAASAGLIGLLLLLRRRLLRRHCAEPDADRNKPPPAQSIFGLLSDRYQMRKFFEHQCISSSSRMMVPQCAGFNYLLLDPDTGDTQSCIVLDPGPAA